MKDVQFVRSGSDEAIVTMRWRRWWGLAKPEIKKYRGCGTVWFDAETGKRQPTHIEMKINAVWNQAKWENEHYR